MTSNPLAEAIASVFYRVFPKTADIELSVDVSKETNLLFFEPQVKYEGLSYRFADLGNVPARVKIGNRIFRVSQKNRQTLRKLSEWDPAFDPKRGFVFHEKDIPDVLTYLRAKGSAQLSPSANHVVVDSRPLQYAHVVKQTGEDISVSTVLADQDSKITIGEAEKGKLDSDSNFVHVSQGFFKKPEKPEFRSFPAELGTQVVSGQQIPFFLLYDLKRMQDDRRSWIAEEIASKKVITSRFEPKVSVDVKGPWIWFDVHYEADRFQIPFNQVQASPPADQFIQRGTDAWVQIDRPTHARVKDHIEKIPEVQAQDRGFRAPTRRFGEVQALLAAVAKIDPTEAFRKFVESLQNFSSIEERKLPLALTGAELRDYQKHGYYWMSFLRDYGLNGILADEMGLGKTVQTLTTLLESHSQVDVPASLIICPPSVLSAWEDDIRRFTSILDFRVTRYTGAGRTKVLENISHYDGVLTTYTTVTKDIGALSKIVWNYVVLDEAQKIKNSETATAKACKQLVAHHKVALTGTPVENRLSELWSIYDFLMPSYLGTQGSFRTRYEIPIMKKGDRSATEELKRRINPFKLRRLKSNVAAELPEKIPMERYCELTPEQVKLYRHYASLESERIRALPSDNVRVDTSILTAILRLKQICCHPALVTHDYENIEGRSGKLDAFTEIIDELFESGEKALIFSQFTEMLQILKHVLSKKGIKYSYLDGGTPEKERARLKHDFQAGSVPFFLISLRAGGLGMTLTEANCVVHYDRWWNPAVEDQATDRVHRIGQKKTVKVFRIHTVGTIEERIGQLLVTKKDLFDSVIEVDDLKKEVSKEELLALFAPPSTSTRRN
ncbi:MAG: DEAD/DEAH box helicase [Candidatus Acidiferrales bacterium]